MASFLTASNIGKLLVTEINDFSCTFFGKLQSPLERSKRNLTPNKRAQKFIIFSSQVICSANVCSDGKISHYVFYT